MEVQGACPAPTRASLPLARRTAGGQLAGLCRCCPGQPANRRPATTPGWRWPLVHGSPPPAAPRAPPLPTPSPAPHRLDALHSGGQVERHAGQRAGGAAARQPHRRLAVRLLHRHQHVVHNRLGHRLLEAAGRHSVRAWVCGRPPGEVEGRSAACTAQQAQRTQVNSGADKAAGIAM
jgi:hypothetical protein